MIRAAAKNFGAVAVVTHPSDYSDLIAELEQNDGGLTLATRKKLAGGFCFPQQGGVFSLLLHKTDGC